MRFLDKLINFIFSLAMLIVSVVILLVIFNFVDSCFVNGLINGYVWNADYKMIVAITSFVVFLAGLKTTIFLSDFKQKKKIPIMVGTDNGNIQIAQETIENTAKAVAYGHEEVKDVNVKMVNRTKGVEIYMSLMVAQDTNIRAITRQIQEEVKEKIHDTTGVYVLNTDIKIRNIVEKNKKVTPTPSEPLVVKGNLEKEVENTTETTNEENEAIQEGVEEIVGDNTEQENTIEENTEL